MQLIFYMWISMKACYKLILRYFDGDGQAFRRFPKYQNSKFAMSLYIMSQKKVRDEVDFLDAVKHQNFLGVDFNTFSIKDSYKVIPSLLMGRIKHSQSTQSNKFAISLQYLKKKLKIELIFACR